MSGTFITQGFVTPTSSAQVSVPATATALSTLITIPDNCQGIRISNNDATATLYMAWSSTLTTTNWDAKLPPAAPSMEILVRPGGARAMYLLSSSGTISVRVTVYG